jgi:hypothetical protein
MIIGGFSDKVFYLDPSSQKTSPLLEAENPSFCIVH